MGFAHFPRAAIARSLRLLQLQQLTLGTLAQLRVLRLLVFDLLLATGAAEALTWESCRLVTSVALDVLRRLLLENVLRGIDLRTHFLLLTPNFFLKDFNAARVAIGLTMALKFRSITLLAQSVLLPFVFQCIFFLLCSDFLPCVVVDGLACNASGCRG